MTDWNQVPITSDCSNPVDGTIKFPQGTEIPSDKVLVRKMGSDSTPASEAFLREARVREDPGPGACVSSSDVETLGGRDSVIEYGKPTRWELYSKQPRLMWKSFVALLTFVGALIAGWSAFLATKAPTANEFDVQFALVVLVIAFIQAIAEVIGELRGD